MKYEDMAGNIKDLNVLSKHGSVIRPVSTVEIAYQEGNGQSIGIESDMWSTHARAIDKTLVAGANYSLTDPNGGYPTVGIKTYSWYVPEDAKGGVYEGYTGNTQADAEKRHNDAAWNLECAVSGVAIRQKLTADGVTYTTYPEMEAPWLSGVNVFSDLKYWFGGKELVTNVKAGTVQTNKDYYRIKSDVYGNINLIRGSSTEYTFNKYTTNNEILNTISGDANWSDVEAKTNLVSCYLNSITRDKGNDTEFVYDGAWYNEAFPGLCVYVATTTFNVELDSSLYGATNVVNMRYAASGAESKADIFTRFNNAWFEADSVNLTTNYGASSVGLGGTNLNLKSMVWHIPNASVFDND
jgi:hypothetical protein